MKGNLGWKELERDRVVLSGLGLVRLKGFVTWMDWMYCREQGFEQPRVAVVWYVRKKQHTRLTGTHMYDEDTLLRMETTKRRRAAL